MFVAVRAGRAAHRRERLCSSIFSVHHPSVVYRHAHEIWRVEVLCEAQERQVGQVGPRRWDRARLRGPTWGSSQKPPSPAFFRCCPRHEKRRAQRAAGARSAQKARGARGARAAGAPEARRRRAERAGGAGGAVGAVGAEDRIIRDYGRIIIISNRFRASGARSDTFWCRLEGSVGISCSRHRDRISRPVGRLPNLADSRLHHGPGWPSETLMPSSKVSEICQSTNS